MTGPATVHVLSDDDAVRDSLDALFQANGLPVRTYGSPAALLQDSPSTGCLLIDLHERGSNPFQLSNQFREHGLSLPTIILVQQAPAAGRSNDATVLQSPVAPGELVAVAKNLLATGQG